MKLNFKDWLLDREKTENENATSTACVAHFSRPVIPGLVRRMKLPFWGEEDPFFKKKSTTVDHGNS